MSRVVQSAILTLLLVGCAEIGEETETGPSLDTIELQAENGIWLDNGLTLANGANLGNGTTLANGMNLGNGIDLANGMNLGNGIDLGNGIVGPYIAPPAKSGLEQWIDVDPAMRKRILRYLVECALPTGVRVQILYRKRLETLGYGVVGLGPGLQSGIMPRPEQEAVSACLLARVNGQGISVTVDLFGPMAGLNSATSAELEVYSQAEAIFFGNLFQTAPKAYACTLGAAYSQEFRACSGGSCGIIQPILYWDHLSRLEDCFEKRICSKGSLGNGGSYGTRCSWWDVTWSYPVTAYLAAADVGEACFGTWHCMDGLTCSSGTCQ
jgi:hypothetical protein